ncbi:hypothetical protein NDN08_003559 [Rhodosorus marinus]|uniref:Eukaryotic translation initiation factor 3 subunit F n=1 Tax=Rhodosorus marinus TaxID=101924 RepID=A0AAV8V1M2_9RHOD|nr:hypothetical protein NDN08_003559 [Rhodosorus marinus]
MTSLDVFVAGQEYGVKQVQVSPMVLFNVLDHYLRRAAGSTRVIGTLLGRVTGENSVEVVSSFPVPHSESGGEVGVDVVYHKSMFELQKSVEPGEEVVGWYATGDAPDANSVLIHEFYGQTCANPVHLLIDAELFTDMTQLKCFISTAYKIDAQDLRSEFRTVPVHVQATKADKTGLEALFRRTVEPLPESERVEKEVSREENEIENLEASLEALLELLKSIGTQVDSVISGETEGDASVGRYLTESLAGVPTIDVELFEKAYGDSMRDLLMVVYLAKLTKTQLNIAERMLSFDLKL